MSLEEYVSFKSWCASIALHTVMTLQSAYLVLVDALPPEISNLTFFQFFTFVVVAVIVFAAGNMLFLEIKEYTTYERSIQTYGILSMLKYIMIDMNMINHHKLIMWKTGEMLVGLAKAFFMDLWSHSCSHHWRPISFLMTLLHSLRDILCSIVCQTYKHMLTWTLVHNMSLREYVSFKAWCASIALHTAADFLQISINNCMVRT